VTEEITELRAAVLDVVKSIVTYDQEEDAVDRIMKLVEEKHHCASCDMHACGDLDRGVVDISVGGFPYERPKAVRAVPLEEG
jgi:hypothetical protein